MTVLNVFTPPYFVLNVFTKRFPPFWILRIDHNKNSSHTKIQIMVNIFRRKKSDKNEGDEASAGQEIGKFLTLRVKIPPNVKPGDTFAVYGK
jgi:hypothetical protein